MDIFSTYRTKIILLCTLLFPDADEKLFEPITAEPPKDSSHGDIASNAAMVLAKPLKSNPRAVAEQLVAELRKETMVESAEIAGPGFINIKLKAPAWHAVVKEVLDNPKEF